MLAEFKLERHCRTVWKLVAKVKDESSSPNHLIKGLPYWIGRGASVSLDLPSSAVSQLHAAIFDREGQLCVKDLNSTNGTFVNKQRVFGERILEDGDLIRFADTGFWLSGHNATPKPWDNQLCEAALALTQFDQLLNGDAVVPHFQPIVSAAIEEHLGFEVFARSPLKGLSEPSSMFRVASSLNMEAELSRTLRSAGIIASAESERLPHLFLNTHAREFENPRELIDCLRRIRRDAPSQGITIEISESMVANTQTMSVLRLALKDLDVNLAYDHFGTGPTTLIELKKGTPDFLKFDMELVQGIHSAPEERQNCLASLLSSVHDLGALAVAEGIENAEDDETCRQIGFDLLQGFYYGAPDKASAYFC